MAREPAGGRRDQSLGYRVEKITDVARFADFGVMITPAMAVDGEV